MPRALIVTDRPELRTELETRLTAGGFAAQCPLVPAAALETLRVDDPALVLLDAATAGLDVAEFCRAVRGRPAGELIVLWVIADHSDPADRRRFFAAGIDDCIELPLEAHWSEMRLAAVGRHAEGLRKLRRTDQALRESVERFNLAVLGANEGLWDAFEDIGPPFTPGKPIWYSQRFKELLGFRDEEFPNVIESWQSRLHPDDRDRVMQAIADHVANRAPYDVEYRLLTKQGEYRWFGARGRAIWDERGKPLRIAGSLRDITDRKQSETALRAEQELLRRLLDLQERDRQLVAYEIHDGIVQEMTGALMHLEDSSRRSPGQYDNVEYERSLKLLRQAVQEARRLVSGLRPPVLDELGVVAAVEYLINEARSDVPQIEYVHRTTFDRLAPPLETAIFRIVQESLTNIRKHSGSQQAKVELIEEGERIRLTVRDWGRGFDPNQIDEKRFGLQGIRERARLLGTCALIESRPGEGATVSVDFPLIPAG